MRMQKRVAARAALAIRAASNEVLLGSLHIRRLGVNASPSARHQCQYAVQLAPRTARLLLRAGQEGFMGVNKLRARMGAVGASIGRSYYLFTGTAIYSLIGTAKLNGLGPGV